MTPKPWSHSALETHDTCPEQYHHKYVLKDLPPEEKSAEQDWGLFVHQQFEWFLTRPGFEMPPDLQVHLPYLTKLSERGETYPNEIYAERKVALSRVPLAPCGYFDKNVWWRGVLDCTIIEKEDSRARISDWKTGKPHTKWDQLAISAIWTFLAYPKIQLVQAEYYWVQTKQVTKKVWSRGEMDALFAMLTPKLQAYVHSYKTDTWTMKQSGLCRGWCPVTTCQFWEPKRPRR